MIGKLDPELSYSIKEASNMLYQSIILQRQIPEFRLSASEISMFFSAYFKVW